MSLEFWERGQWFGLHKVQVLLACDRGILKNTFIRDDVIAEMTSSLPAKMMGVHPNLFFAFTSAPVIIEKAN